MKWLLPDSGGSAATRGRAAALARAETPLFLAVLGLLLVLWIGAVILFGPLGPGFVVGQTMQRPNLVLCDNLDSRAPGELLRCLPALTETRTIGI
jgi:hypothetical protein